jgi:hypothetical protein
MATGFGTAGIGATLAGGLLSAYGAEKEGAATQQAYNYRAEVSRINADINRQNANWTREKGEKEQIAYGVKAAQQRGQIRAAQGASNIDVNTGSNKRVQESQEKTAQTDMEQIRANAAKVAYDYETKAYMDDNQATLDTMAGENASEAGNIKAMSSIIGTVSGVSDKWQKGRTTGLW